MTLSSVAPAMGTPGPEKYFDDPKVNAMLQAAVRGEWESAARQIEQGADVNAVGRQGITPLLWLMTVSPEGPKVEFLLKHGADPNYREPVHRVSPIYFAAGGDKPEILRILLAYKGDPNLKGPQDRTPLMTAILEGREVNIEMLLRDGADPNVRDGLNSTAAEVAVARGRFDLAYRLVSEGHGGDLQGLGRMATRRATTPGSEQSRWRDKLLSLLREKGVTPQ
ncbi:MAG TPA: ankyrin repeat domain-containing protein [Usitatibacter sp.]|nr:ankyrin repeat domain-containing protein [Usitatibacter sp.]